jgi:hypothetical protein
MSRRDRANEPDTIPERDLARHATPGRPPQLRERRQWLSELMTGHCRFRVSVRGTRPLRY